MSWTSCLLVPVMLLIPGGQQPANPWKDKVPTALAAVERSPTIPAYREALDVTWRADDWQAGLRLARAALEKHPKAAELRGRIVRALWRGGQLEEAERIAAALAPTTHDPVALTMLIQIHLARREIEAANAVADRLQKLGPATALEYYCVLAARLEADQLHDAVPLLRRIERLTDPANGYPEIYLAEALGGMDEFFAAIGSQPLNQVTHYGSAPMPVLIAFRLPYCDALINGQGPYRLIVDTGGSVGLSLDDDVARELGLKSYGTANVHGIAGAQESSQTLVAELRMGAIVCRRVLTRVFAFPQVIELGADGILGTGVFARARLTLDFEHGRLHVAPPSGQSAEGRPVELWLVGDAKLLVPLKLAGRPAVGLLDSGADVAAVSPLRLRELFPDRELKTVPVAGLGVGSGNDPGLTLTPGVDLEFAGRHYSNYSGIGLDALDDLLSPIIGVQTDVLLGMPVFRDMKRFTVDFRQGRMWVAWLEQAGDGSR